MFHLPRFDGAPTGRKQKCSRPTFAGTGVNSHLRYHPAWRKTRPLFRTEMRLRLHATPTAPLPPSRFNSPSEAHSLTLASRRSHRPPLSGEVLAQGTSSSSSVCCYYYNKNNAFVKGILNFFASFPDKSVFLFNLPAIPWGIGFSPYRQPPLRRPEHSRPQGRRQSRRARKRKGSPRGDSEGSRGNPKRIPTAAS